MVDDPQFNLISTELKSNLDVYLNEVSAGLDELEKVVVSVSSHLSDKTRGFLTPTLYAYWERFFRLSTSEYLRSISECYVDLADAKIELTILRLKSDISSYVLSNDYKFISNHDLIHSDFASFKTASQNYWNSLNRRLHFSDSNEWIETDSNVSSKVVCSGLKKLGLNSKLIHNKVNQHVSHRFQRDLDELLNDRNAIAHGEQLMQISATRWQERITFVSTLASCFKEILIESFEKKDFLK